MTVALARQDGLPRAFHRVQAAKLAQEPNVAIVDRWELEEPAVNALLEAGRPVKGQPGTSPRVMTAQPTNAPRRRATNLVFPMRILAR
jgi:hypothetical protein